MEAKTPEEKIESAKFDWIAEQPVAVEMTMADFARISSALKNAVDESVEDHKNGDKKISAQEMLGCLQYIRIIKMITEVCEPRFNELDAEWKTSRGDFAA